MKREAEECETLSGAVNMNAETNKRQAVRTGGCDMGSGVVGPGAPAGGNVDEASACAALRSGVLRFLTREELAEVLQISVRTLDAMVAAVEVPCVRLRGGIVRFHLPDVVRHLTATAVTRKHGRAAAVEGGSVERESVGARCPGRAE